MKRSILSPLARADLGEIHDYIAERDADAALDFVTRLELVCESLAPCQGKGVSAMSLGKACEAFRLRVTSSFTAGLQPELRSRASFTERGISKPFLRASRLSLTEHLIPRQPAGRLHCLCITRVVNHEVGLR